LPAAQTDFNVPTHVVQRVRFKALFTKRPLFSFFPKITGDDKNLRAAIWFRNADSAPPDRASLCGAARDNRIWDKYSIRRCPWLDF